MLAPISHWWPFYATLCIYTNGIKTACGSLSAEKNKICQICKTIKVIAYLIHVSPSWWKDSLKIRSKLTFWEQKRTFYHFYHFWRSILSPCSNVQSMAEGGDGVVAVGGTGVVVVMLSLQDWSLMMKMSSREKISSTPPGNVACKTICKISKNNNVNNYTNACVCRSVQPHNHKIIGFRSHTLFRITHNSIYTYTL